MYWFAGIALCLIIAFITWGCSEDRQQILACKKLNDLAQFCDAAVADVCYYELKRDRKRILEFIGDGAIITQPVGVYMLNDTLKRVDAKLAGFSDEEKQIYDAVYGENAA